jgi:hypothetical protein
MEVVWNCGLCLYERQCLAASQMLIPLLEPGICLALSPDPIIQYFTYKQENTYLEQTFQCFP